MPFNSPLSRRDMLRASGLAGATLGMGALGMTLSSCGNSPSGTAGNPAASGAGAVASALQPGQSVEGTIYSDVVKNLPRGGNLDITLTFASATLNILSTTTSNTQWYADPCHDFLERFDTNGNLVPSLAQKLEFVNPTTYRYTLHEARFHNGRQVTAEDVVATVDYLRSPALASNRAGAFRDVQFRALNQKTVEVVLPEPNAGFRYNLVGLCIVPSEAFAQLATNPIGCGPYRFEQWVKDSYIDYSAFTDYWNKDLPRLDRLRLTLRTDSEAASQAIRADQTDVLDVVPTAQVPMFQQLIDSKRLAGVSYSAGWNFVGLNTTRPKLSDPRIRRALALSIDRTAVARVSGGSLNQPICTAPYAPTHPRYPKNLDYPRDTAQAKALMQQANGKDLTIELLATDATMEAIATVLRSNWAEIGVTANILRIDVPTYVSRRSRKDFDAVASQWFFSPEPSYVLDQLFSSKGTNNFWGYSNPQADQLITQGRSTTDPEARASIYNNLLKLLFIDEPSMIPLSTAARLMVFKPGVDGDLIVPSSFNLWRYAIAARR
ncbi:MULTISPECIES: ABC transporter substrate-binding protein [Amycolatopsis]|uniref:ABC-type transport system, substrate-binding protein n=3 Tax=Amycolatopsis TaxID=1813 RepID=A0A1I3XBA8_9PSEU|nr:ABC transporter substrate-binding protein [Amycolatopsis sacchari]SFK16843.1 ABC-type transport system, substrate-binding protein [Amycolatopsis sacchari]